MRRRGFSLIVLVAALALMGQRCSDPAPPSNAPPADPPTTPAPPTTPEPPVDVVLAVESVARGLEQPVFVTAPVNDPRLFIIEQKGVIRLVKDGVLRDEPFLDIKGRVLFLGERGLLGMAFAPDFAETGIFYVNYSDIDGDTIVARFRVGADPDFADAGSFDEVLKVNQPFGNHNGGMLAFGLDGFLYIGLGDGGNAGDPQNQAQNDATLLGKMLRIDVSGGLGSGYSIPPSNPFVGAGIPLPEIWAKGLRNPFRYSFDRVMGDLYIGDVGQRDFEEINVAPFADTGGRNYGWRLMEGTSCFIPSAGCNDGTLTLPVHEYSHDGGRCSVTGGYVYRGAIEAIFGHYFFADFCSAEIFSFVWDGAGGVTTFANRTAELAPPGGFRRVTSFGEDGFGELYVAQFGAGESTGEVFRIVALTTSGARRAPVVK